MCFCNEIIEAKGINHIIMVKTWLTEYCKRYCLDDADLSVAVTMWLTYEIGYSTK